MQPDQNSNLTPAPRPSRRTKVVHLRLSDPEWVAIEQTAQAADMTVSEFLRSLSLEGAGICPFLSDDDRAVLDYLVDALRGAGLAVNQLERLAHRGGSVPQLELSKRLRELQQIICGLTVELTGHAKRGRQRRIG